ncbi:hypothetical protein H181DRAFT_00409 [Streptomyces sp. WMMB 714]|nr:hypothetical protein H181DRAFT_00409 [Streptomyces sp. WMMB 714]
MEAGDAATWGSTVVAFGTACFAVAQGIAQRRDLRRQNELQAEVSQLQRRQIETAERRTLVMEQLLAQVTAPSPYVPPVPYPPRQRPEGAPADLAPYGQGAEVPAQWAGTGEPDAMADEDAPTFDSEPVGGTPDGAGNPPMADAVEPVGDTAEPMARTFEPVAEPVNGHPQSIPQPSQQQWPPPQQQWPFPQQGVGPWYLERFGKHGYALRNTGPVTLTGVRVDPANLPSSARGVPEYAVVRAGEAAEFLMAPMRGEPLPAQVLVTWDDQPQGVPVPVPPG